MKREMERKNLEVGGRDVVVQGAAGDDRITSLPDDILLSVFSSLSVEQCASLSAVSREWRRLMERVLVRYEFTTGNSSIIEPPWRSPDASVRGFHLVNWFNLVNWFHLANSIVPDHPLRHALDAAEGLVVEKTICHNFCISDIPDFVFQIKNLRALSIKGYQSVYPRELGCTLLRTLKLEGSSISPWAIKKILANCRRLETLHLVAIDCTDTLCTHLEIHSESLKNLWIRPDQDGYCCLRIDAPNIEVLILDLHRCDLLDIQAASKLKEVLLSVSNPQYAAPSLWLSAEKFLGFLLEAKELTSLSLRKDVVERWAGAERWEELDKFFPSFEKMEFLRISLSVEEESEAMLLVAMLEKCPRLTQLSLKLIPKRRGEGEHTSIACMLWERLERLELFDRLQGIELDLSSISHYEEKLMSMKKLEFIKLTSIILTEATMLKRAKLIFPCSWVSEIKELLYSRKAPQKEEEPCNTVGWWGGLATKFTVEF